MSYINGFYSTQGKKHPHHQSFDLGEVPRYQPPGGFNADVLDTLGAKPNKAKGVKNQWEEYYSKPGRNMGTESRSSTEAYAADEGKRVTHQLWHEVMGTGYQIMSHVLDNQSMISTTQSIRDIFCPHLTVNLAGLIPLDGHRPQSAMSDPTGGYVEIRG